MGGTCRSRRSRAGCGASGGRPGSCRGRSSRSMLVTSSRPLPHPRLEDEAEPPVVNQSSITCTVGRRSRGRPSRIIAPARLTRYHHCQLLWHSVGNAAKAGCVGSHEDAERVRRLAARPGGVPEDAREAELDRAERRRRARGRAGRAGRHGRRQERAAAASSSSRTTMTPAGTECRRAAGRPTRPSRSRTACPRSPRRAGSGAGRRAREAQRSRGRGRCRCRPGRRAPAARRARHVARRRRRAASGRAR